MTAYRHCHHHIIIIITITIIIFIIIFIFDIIVFIITVLLLLLLPLLFPLLLLLLFIHTSLFAQPFCSFPVYHRKGRLPIISVWQQQKWQDPVHESCVKQRNRKPTEQPAGRRTQPTSQAIVRQRHVPGSCWRWLVA